jgi:NAD(P)-dependent dehydrogenase (short-subunit alcohol dehydrogenase family)
MNYFVTGATGFIGKYLVANLLKREGTVFVLVRKESLGKLKDLKAFWGPESKRVVPIQGDLSKAKLGVSPANLKKLEGPALHMFHLAAIYDLSASAESQDLANILGTDHALDFAEQVGVRCFHHCSSIAAAGLYKGTFREDMFEEAEGLDHPYFRTKHESEGLVRARKDLTWRIYRPGLVIGHSKTGQMDKTDGPYYFFKLLQKMRNNLPRWMPTIGIEGGRLNMVPVDYVADAMDYIAHKRGQDGKCFHLVEPEPMRAGEVLNLFARAGHAPEMTMRIDLRMFSFVPPAVRQGLMMVAPVRRITNQILKDLHIPPGVLKFLNYPTRFDSRNTDTVLRGTNIKVPDLRDYAWRLWDYWERHLDPDLFVDRSLRGAVQGKNVMVTGASSGIGHAAALLLGEAGARVIIVARGLEKLQETKAEIEAAGGEVHLYSCDISDMADCDRLVAQVLADHGHVDVLVNNAGRSIRRSIGLSFDRFHDFERTMQLNYFGSLRLIMGFLPMMQSNHRGHVINISSIGVLSNAPRFSAYVASKAALDAFSRCAASEFCDEGIAFTTINMPLVRTPMIAPTKMYEQVPTISPEEAADMIGDAIIRRPYRIATRLGIFAQVMHSLFPKVGETVMNTAYRMFPDSSAAKGEKLPDQKPSNEMIAFASLMRGIHW